MRQRLPLASLLVLFLPLTLGAPGCDGGTPPEGPCTNDTRADSYQAGQVLSKSGQDGRVVVRLVAAEPTPPIKGDNAWTVQIVDPQGAPMSGATLSIQPYMPDHKHGTSIKATSTPLATPGQYRLAPLNLFMASLWEVRIGVTTQSGDSDRVVFSACIEG